MEQSPFTLLHQLTVHLILYITASDPDCEPWGNTHHSLPCKSLQYTVLLLYIMEQPSTAKVHTTVLLMQRQFDPDGRTPGETFVICSVNPISKKEKLNENLELVEVKKCKLSTR